MNNLKENFLILLSIVKQSLQNVLDANGNLPKPGPQPKFSDAEVISLSLLSEAMMFDSENYLFKCLQKERQGTFAHLIERSRYNRRRKQLNGLTEKVRRELLLHQPFRQMGLHVKYSQTSRDDVDFIGTISSARFHR